MFITTEFLVGASPISVEDVDLIRNRLTLAGYEVFEILSKEDSTRFIPHKVLGKPHWVNIIPISHFRCIYDDFTLIDITYDDAMKMITEGYEDQVLFARIKMNYIEVFYSMYSDNYYTFNRSDPDFVDKLKQEIFKDPQHSAKMMFLAKNHNSPTDLREKVYLHAAGVAEQLFGLKNA